MASWPLCWNISECHYIVYFCMHKLGHKLGDYFPRQINQKKYRAHKHDVPKAKCFFLYKISTLLEENEWMRLEADDHD